MTTGLTLTSLLLTFLVFETVYKPKDKKQGEPLDTGRRLDNYSDRGIDWDSIFTWQNNLRK